MEAGSFKRTQWHPVLYPTSILRIWMCLHLPLAAKLSLLWSRTSCLVSCFLFYPPLPLKKPPQFKSLKLKFVLYAHTHTHTFVCFVGTGSDWGRQRALIWGWVQSIGTDLTVFLVHSSLLVSFDPALVVSDLLVWSFNRNLSLRKPRCLSRSSD